MISYFLYFDTFYLQFLGSVLCFLRWVRRLHDLLLYTFTYFVNRTFLFFLLPPVCNAQDDILHWLIYHKMILIIILCL